MRRSVGRGWRGDGAPAPHPPTHPPTALSLSPQAAARPPHRNPHTPLPRHHSPESAPQRARWGEGGVHDAAPAARDALTLGRRSSFPARGRVGGLAAIQHPRAQLSTHRGQASAHTRSAGVRGGGGAANDFEPRRPACRARKRATQRAHVHRPCAYCRHARRLATNRTHTEQDRFEEAPRLKSIPSRSRPGPRQRCAPHQPPPPPPPPPSAPPPAAAALASANSAAAPPATASRLEPSPARSAYTRCCVSGCRKGRTRRTRV